ncbi:hypothetical protein [Marinigracilibium pacificum]|uniref:Uncharacterized protein n=1 Tax=Marinigracilibium pacificum TaxID=2729599 RepID=A0A848IZD0_9BACT|nr:hypothetical protein [Marinigracilibium pacificum]NMM49637.1 hypothetical protein [Marinigracilibium pacificum]
MKIDKRNKELVKPKSKEELWLDFIMKTDEVLERMRYRDITISEGTERFKGIMFSDN